MSTLKHLERKKEDMPNRLKTTIFVATQICFAIIFAMACGYRDAEIAFVAFFALLCASAIYHWWSLMDFIDSAIKEFAEMESSQKLWARLAMFCMFAMACKWILGWIYGWRW